MIRLCCLDLAGTTVADDGAVMGAFAAALAAVGVATAGPERARMDAYVAETMGTAKIEVFTALLGTERAAVANAAFEQAYGAGIVTGVAPIPGAAETIRALRRGGVKVALHTGFSAVTRDQLLGALGWEDLADLTLCPAEAGRGRPHPDMILVSMLRLGVDDAVEVAAVGDTAADIEAGRRAGCAIVAGVLTGADDRARLEAAGATAILGSVRELPALFDVPS